MGNKLTNFIFRLLGIFAFYVLLKATGVETNTSLIIAFGIYIFVGVSLILDESRGLK